MVSQKEFQYRDTNTVFVFTFLKFCGFLFAVQLDIFQQNLLFLFLCFNSCQTCLLAIGFIGIFKKQWLMMMKIEVSPLPSTDMPLCCCQSAM